MNKTASSEFNAGTKRLYLSASDKRLAGVCGGIAQYFGVDATLIRLAWIVLTVVSGVIPGIVAYVIAAIVIPQEPTPSAEE